MMRAFLGMLLVSGCMVPLEEHEGTRPGVIRCRTAADCPPDLGADCRYRACQDNVCVRIPYPAGTPCFAGGVCDNNGTCQ